MRLVRGSGLILLAMLAFAAPPAASAPLLGLQEIEASAADVDLASSTGVKLLRVQAFWAALEPERSGAVDPAALARLDAVIARARMGGMKVVLFADGTPCWASSAPGPRACGGGPPSFASYRYPPRTTAPFVAFSKFLVQRYADDLAAYEVWNEPDHSNEQYWAGPRKVERYVALLKATYRPLKRLAPRLPVLGGSFVGTNGAWLKAMYRQGARGNYDGLAVHFYSLPLHGLRTTRDVQRRNRDTAPLWLTEFGWSSCTRAGGPTSLSGHPCTTRAGQAANLVDLVVALRRTTWVKATVMYAVRDEGNYRFGIVDSASRSKPVRTALERAARSGDKLRSPRPNLRLSATASGRLVVRMTFTPIDTATLDVRVGGVLRYRALVVSDRRRQARLVLPASIPARSVVATLREGFSGRTVSRRR